MNLRSEPLVITMGDPSGIGPEIIAKSFAQGRAAKCVVVGCPEVMSDMVASLALDLQVEELGDIHQHTEKNNILPVLRSSRSQGYPVGVVSAHSGQAAFAAIEKAIGLARSGQAAGMITAPIHKEALAAAGYSFPGHTEILAAYGGAQKVAMMLANDEIRTVLVSIHMSLRDAIEHGDFDAQMQAIRLADAACRDLGITEPRVAVAGLNPHAGEGGLFGREEIEIISPAIDAARSEGINVSGPWPGDTVFMSARTGRFDVVVAQYHDQGLIPVKYLGIEKGVNVTLGLPFVRTSPDHGTAFDIVGKGVADPSSLSTAIDYARRLVGTAEKNKETA